jgi:cardiolipin synthase
MGFTREGIEAIYRRSFVDGNEVSLISRGREAFEQIFESVRQAQRLICLQFYCYKNDETGSELAKLLKEKAGEGVAVYILYDHLGSFSTPRSFWKGLRLAGINVRASHPFSFRHPFRYRYRDHNKVLIVDGVTAFTGGLNIANAYRGVPKWRKDPWRDTGVIMRGPVASALLDEFSHAWALWGGDALPAVSIGHERKDGLPAMPIFTRSSRGRRRMRRLLYYSINHASEEICLTTAYFVPSRRMLHTLEEAVERGVRVRLLIPGSSDVPPAHYAGRFFFKRLLNAGVEIHTYRGAMMHAKTHLFDNIWSIVGSANLDLRSLRWNDEGNVGILDAGFAAGMKQMFNLDIEGSTRILPHVWRNRPLREKTLERLFSFFRRRL